ncbi:MAG TPA: transcriptional regulator PpsR [Rhizobiaceae bacterium]|nr:transcriptional regulator PpsR [Rhizobiaceae bacterium]
MDQDRNKVAFRQFSRASELIAQLGDRGAALIASIGSDISLAVSPDGIIEDVAFRNPDLVGYNCDTWPGKRWRDVVTVESVDKIDALMADSEKQTMTRRRQVNHPMKGMADLPVEYLVVKIPGSTWRLALGNDLRSMSALQRQLVQFQVELETEYRKIRETESRYRTIFHMTREPMIVAGDQDRRILDVNQAAIGMLGKPARKLVGENTINLFDKSDRDQVGQKLQEVQHSGTPQTVVARLAGASGEREMTIEPYREAGRTNMLIHVGPGRGASGNGHLTDSEDFQIDAIAEPVAVTDASGAVVAINDLFLDLVNGLNRSQVIGRHLNNWVGGSSVDLQVLMSRLRDEGQVRGFSTLVRDEIGVTSPALVSAARQTSSDGRERYAFLVSENARRESGLPAQASQHIQGMGDFSELVGRVPLKELIREAADVIEVMCIEAALRQTDNNRASAAELLGLSRQSLYLKLRRHGLADFDTDS